MEVDELSKQEFDPQLVDALADLLHCCGLVNLYDSRTCAQSNSSLSLAVTDRRLLPAERDHPDRHSQRDPILSLQVEPRDRFDSGEPLAEGVRMHIHGSSRPGDVAPLIEINLERS